MASFLNLLPWHLPADAAAHGAALDHELRLNLWIALGLLALAHLFLIAGPILRRRAKDPSALRSLLLEYIPLSAGDRSLSSRRAEIPRSNHEALGRMSSRLTTKPWSSRHAMKV